MIEMVKVVSLKHAGDFKLEIVFSNGASGVNDFAGMLKEDGSMLTPLKEVEMFKRAFLQQGVPTWPNGYDVDPIALHQEMKEAGLLTGLKASA